MKIILLISTFIAGLQQAAVLAQYAELRHLNPLVGNNAKALTYAHVDAAASLRFAAYLSQYRDITKPAGVFISCSPEDYSNVRLWSPMEVSSGSDLAITLGPKATYLQDNVILFGHKEPDYASDDDEFRFVFLSGHGSVSDQVPGLFEERILELIQTAHADKNLKTIVVFSGPNVLQNLFQTSVLTPQDESLKVLHDLNIGVIVAGDNEFFLCAGLFTTALQLALQHHSSTDVSMEVVLETTRSEYKKLFKFADPDETDSVQFDISLPNTIKTSMASSFFGYPTVFKANTDITLSNSWIDRKSIRYFPGSPASFIGKRRGDGTRQEGSWYIRTSAESFFFKGTFNSKGWFKEGNWTQKSEKMMITSSGKFENGVLKKGSRMYYSPLGDEFFVGFEGTFDKNESLITGDVIGADGTRTPVGNNIATKDQALKAGSIGADAAGGTRSLEIVVNEATKNGVQQKSMVMPVAVGAGVLGLGSIAIYMSKQSEIEKSRAKTKKLLLTAGFMGAGAIGIAAATKGRLWSKSGNSTLLPDLSPPTSAAVVVATSWSASHTPTAAVIIVAVAAALF